MKDGSPSKGFEESKSKGKTD
jgi:mRNA m6A methyltransferase catalytic subunit